MAQTDVYLTHTELTNWITKVGSTTIPKGYQAYVVGTGLLVWNGTAFRPILEMKLNIVTGANAATNITLTGCKKDRDIIVNAVNLTDAADIDVAAAKAEYAGPAAGYDATISAKTAGAAGNQITVQFFGDSGSGVTVEVVNKVVQIHYVPDTSTIANVATAIGALVSPNDIIEIKSTAQGTTARTLTAAMAWDAAAPLAGGYDAYKEVPAITSDGYIQFAKAATGTKKLLVQWAKLG